MADSARTENFTGFLKPVVDFKEGLQIAPEALVIAANQKYAFEPEKRTAALKSIVRGEISKLNFSVTARLDLFTQPAAEGEEALSENARTERQIVSLGLRISRQVDVVKEIILQIPDHEVQVQLAAETLALVEGVPLVK